MVRRHRQQLRAQQAAASGVASSQLCGGGGGEGPQPSGGGRAAAGMGADGHKEEWLRRLEQLEEMEERASEEDSADDDGSDDSSDSESDSDSDDGSGDATKETQAEPGGESDEDSEEDLPANLHTFRHVKIESPMPSAERKFQYSEVGASPAEDTEEPVVEDEVADITTVGEQIRGRTRSFTRTTDRGIVRCGSQGRDSSNDSKDDPSEFKPHSGQRSLVARRVSWADQSSMVGSEESAINIRYTATPSASATTSSTDSTPSSKSIVISADSHSSTAACDLSLNDNVKSSQSEPETSSAITSPADLVKLTTGSVSITAHSKASEEKESEPAPTPVVATADSSTGPKPRSILKKTASQDIIHVPTTKGTSWLQSAESVPITTVYDHEPVLQTSPSPPPQPQVQAMTYKVVARDPDAAGEADAAGKEDTVEAPKRVSKFKAARQKQ